MEKVKIEKTLRKVVWLTPEQVEKVEELAVNLDRRKASLYREAVNMLIEKYGKQLKKK